MTSMQFVLTIIIACAAAVVGAGYGVGYATKKGVNVGQAINTADTLTDTLTTAFAALKPLLPASAALSTVETILNLADVGVNAAEKLYKTATIEKDSRKAEATEFVTNALTAAGVEITPEIQQVIDGAITGAVAMLPKTHDDTGAIITN